MINLQYRLRSLKRRIITRQRHFFDEFRSLDKNGLTVNQAFELAFGKPISESDLASLRQRGVTIRDGESGILRKMICGLEAALYKSPMSVRFTAAQLRTLKLERFKLVVDVDDVSVSRQIVLGGTYEPHVTAFLASTLQPAMTALDIGGNIGFHTMLMASVVGRSGKVLTFEPSSENCRLILLSLAENGFSNVVLHPVALSNAPGHACFSPMLGSNGGFLPDSRETLLHPNCIIVPRQRLDEAVQECVDLVKIDVEGAEYLVLSGGVGMIRRSRPTIVAEFSLEMLPRVSGISGPDFLRWMTGFGYRIVLLKRDLNGLEEITDIDEFIQDWGNPLRIEDLAFLPGS